MKPMHTLAERKSRIAQMRAQRAIRAEQPVPRIRYVKHTCSEFISSFPVITVRGKKRTLYRIFAQENETYNGASIYVLAMKLTPKSREKPEQEVKKTRRIATASISFWPNSKETILITDIQGAKMLKEQGIPKANLASFSAIANNHWAQFLVKQIEAHAKSLGFREIKIQRPETSHDFQHPSITGNDYENYETDCERVRQSMLRLYYGVAKSLHYTIDGNYFVKQL